MGRISGARATGRGAAKGFGARGKRQAAHTASPCIHAPCRNSSSTVLGDLHSGGPFSVSVAGPPADTHETRTGRARPSASRWQTGRASSGLVARARRTHSEGAAPVLSADPPGSSPPPPSDDALAPHAQHSEGAAPVLPTPPTLAHPAGPVQSSGLDVPGPGADVHHVEERFEGALAAPPPLVARRSSRLLGLLTRHRAACPLRTGSEPIGTATGRLRSPAQVRPPAGSTRFTPARPGSHAHHRHACTPCPLSCRLRRAAICGISWAGHRTGCGSFSSRPSPTSEETQGASVFPR